MSSHQVAFIQKRRSTRIYNAIPLAVHGSDAFRAPYLEQVSTIAVNCHGCRYQSKHEVIQGDTVYLEVKPSSESSTAYSCEARVKWVLRIMNKNPRFEIAVELVNPGNVWGLVSPPEDWFSNQAPKVIEHGNPPLEHPLAKRTDRQAAPTLNEDPARASRLEKAEVTGAPLPSTGQLMAGFGKQIQSLVSQAATAAFVKERDHLMAEFRAQLQSEATRTLERVISTSKAELARRMLKELNDAHEAAARSIYERWSKQIEQETRNAEECIVAQAKEVSRRVEGMRVGTIERLQRNMDASRTEAVERFLSRLREQVAPLLEGAQATLQNLTATENKLRVESEALLERYENSLRQATLHSIEEVQEKTVGMLGQFESDVANKLAESHQGLRESSAEVIAETTKIALELSQDCEETVRGQLRSLTFSAADDVTKILKERAAQISSEFSNQLECNTRSYLEFVSKSIAQIPKETLIRSGD